MSPPSRRRRSTLPWRIKPPLSPLKVGRRRTTPSPKTSGATVDWRKFDSGASVVRALASGDVQIGNLGSSPLAVAASQQVPIEVFLLGLKARQLRSAGGEEKHQ